MNDAALQRFREKGIWIFLCFDLLIFFLFFLVFILERNASHLEFMSSQKSLNETIGFINTLVLITSSWALVMSLKLMVSNGALAGRYLKVSMFLGGVFCLLKIYEYYEKLSMGVSVVENTFFTFYFLLTFIHFCHVVAGLLALWLLLGWFTNKQKSAEYCQETGESIGIFWHMVDLLWVMLFMMLYLLR